jgi:phosphoribosyl-AMP cyclohydrolase
VLDCPSRRRAECDARSVVHGAAEQIDFSGRIDVNGPDFSKNELIPVIAQDDATGEVLMLAYMNQEAYAETLRAGRVCYYSRSRKKLWRKGEESGNVQELRSIYFDCDADTLLVKVNQIGGAACHEGFKSCFFRRIDPQTGAVSVQGERVFDPAAVYGKK